MRRGIREDDQENKAKRRLEDVERADHTMERKESQEATDRLKKGTVKGIEVLMRSSSPYRSGDQSTGDSGQNLQGAAALR